MLNFIFIIFQFVVPQHLLSRLVGKLAATKNLKLKNYLISYFLKNYDMQDCIAVNMNLVIFVQYLNYLD